MEQGKVLQDVRITKLEQTVEAMDAAKKSSTEQMKEQIEGQIAEIREQIETLQLTPR